MPSRTASRTNSRTTSRAASNARTEIIDMLKEDHKRVKKAYREFTKLDREEDPERCEALVRQVLADLEVHTALEEELLYPAARDAIAEPDLVDEAEVEHESAHALIEQLKSMDAEDDKFTARFTVLCEYVMHHVKEEETQLFPQLERARLDWESLAREISDRRAELAPPEAGDDATAMAQGNSDDSDDSERGEGDAARGQGKAAGGAKSRGGSPQEGLGGMGGEAGEAMSSRRV